MDHVTNELSSPQHFEKFRTIVRVVTRRSVTSSNNSNGNIRWQFYRCGRIHWFQRRRSEMTIFLRKQRTSKIVSEGSNQGNHAQFQMELVTHCDGRLKDQACREWKSKETSKTFPGEFHGASFFFIWGSERMVKVVELKHVFRVHTTSITAFSITCSVVFRGFYRFRKVEINRLVSVAKLKVFGGNWECRQVCNFVERSRF